METRFNELLFNEVLDITNDTLRPGQSYSKMYGIEPRYNEPRYNEPRYNEFLDITNIIRKPKRKIYLDIKNYSVNTRQINPGRGGTPLYGLYWYVRPQMVWCFSRFGHRVSILPGFGYFDHK